MKGSRQRKGPIVPLRHGPFLLHVRAAGPQWVGGWWGAASARGQGGRVACAITSNDVIQRDVDVHGYVFLLVVVLLVLAAS